MSAPKRLFRLPGRSARDIAEEFETELRFHFDLRVTELVEGGATREAALAIAEREMGDVDDARRYVTATDRAIERGRRRRELGHDVWSEAKQAIRRLRRAPVFAVTTVVTLALGIAGTGIMFSLVSGILLKPLPYGDPGRLAMIWGHLPQVSLGANETPIGGLYFTTLRDEGKAFRSVAAFRGRSFNLGDAGSVERIDGIQTTGDFFDVMTVPAQRGRYFSRADETTDVGRVAVIGDQLWRERFGADPAVVGRAILLDGIPYTVIGIAPRGFRFPVGTEMPASFQLPARPAVWIAMPPPRGGPWDLAVVARLGDSVSTATAQADLDRVAGIQERILPAMKGWTATRLVPLKEQAVGASVPMLWSLVAAVALLLAIACVNAAQLLLAEIQTRHREHAVRVALGASRARVAAGLVTEVALLTGAAGGLGLALGSAGLGLVKRYGSAGLPRLGEVSFDRTTAVVAVLVAIASGLVASLVPVVAGNRLDLSAMLGRGAKGVAGRALSGRSRRAMVIAEVALSVVLVAGAGLLIRSLTEQLGRPTGFTSAEGLTFEVTLPNVRYREKQGPNYMEHPEAVRFFGSVLERIRAIPGVRAAAIGKPLPLSGAQESSVFDAEGVDLRRGGDGPTPAADFTVASSAMFAALGTPLVAGREFTDADREDAPPVAIVNRAMAEWLWPGQSALGKRVRMMGPPESAPWMTVVGVSADLKRYSLIESPRPELIVPYTQKPYPTFATMQFVVRTALPAAALMPSIQAAIAAFDPTIPASRVRSIEQLVSETSANARFASQLMSAFGATALVLAMVGLYGVIAHGVSQRRQEFGVRRALGATPPAISGLVLREAMRLLALGIPVGIVGALLAARALRGLLYQVSALDPITYAGAIALLVGAAVLAALLPARRAARIDPRVAMEE